MAEDVEVVRVGVVGPGTAHDRRRQRVPVASDARGRLLVHPGERRVPALPFLHPAVPADEDEERDEAGEAGSHAERRV